MASSSSTLSSLPLELIEEILYRTPVESLIRSMLTCKQWNALINDKDKSFIYEHLARSKVKFLRTNQTMQIVDLVTKTCSVTPMPYDFKNQYIISAMFHCDGLMLCSCHTLSSFVKLALWNPLTRKVSWVDEPSSKPFWTSDYYGIGYDINKPQRDYKILKLSGLYDGEVDVHIYECMSKSWRTLLDETKVDWKVYGGCIGVYVMGNMYWLAKKESRNYVLSFDFSDETFKDICFCDLPYYSNYLGCYDEDKLSLLQQNKEVLSPIEVWVSSKLADGNVSFAQYFKVDNPNLPAIGTFWDHPVYCIAKDKLIIAFYEGEKKMFVFDFSQHPNVSTSITLCEIDKGGAISNQPVTVRLSWNVFAVVFRCGCFYVPSLVSLPV